MATTSPTPMASHSTTWPVWGGQRLLSAPKPRPWPHSLPSFAHGDSMAALTPRIAPTAPELSRPVRFIQHTGLCFQADTPWHLVAELSLEDARAFLDARRAQGFSAMQLSALPMNPGQRNPATNQAPGHMHGTVALNERLERWPTECRSECRLGVPPTEPEAPSRAADS